LVAQHIPEILEMIASAYENRDWEISGVVQIVGAGSLPPHLYHDEKILSQLLLHLRGRANQDRPDAERKLLAPNQHAGLCLRAGKIHRDLTKAKRQAVAKPKV